VRHWLNQSTVELNGSQGLDSSRSDCMQSSTIISRRRPPSFLPCRFIFFHTCFALAAPSRSCRSNPKDVLKWKSSVTARKSDVTQKENSKFWQRRRFCPSILFHSWRLVFSFFQKEFKKKNLGQTKGDCGDTHDQENDVEFRHFWFSSPLLFFFLLSYSFFVFYFLSYRRVI
jgi:hypothetical protein